MFREALSENSGWGSPGGAFFFDYSQSNGIAPRFDISRSWRDIEKRCLMLDYGIPARGEIIVFVGPYVGTFSVAAQVYLKKRGSIPSPAVCGLFGSHVDPALFVGEGKNFCQGLSAASVARVLERRNLRPTAEQKRLFDSIGQSSSAIFVISTVPGGNKSTGAAALALAVSERLEEDQLILCMFLVSPSFCY